MNMQDQENWYQELEQRKELEREAKNGSGIIGFLFLIGVILGIIQLVIFIAK